MLAFIDVECTGIGRGFSTYCSYDVIELSCIITDEDYNVKGSFSDRAKPGTKNWSRKSESIHGISLLSLCGAYNQFAFVVAFDNFVSSIKGSFPGNIRLVDHSIGRFDFRWLKSMYGFYHKDFIHGFYKHFKDSQYESTINLARASRYDYANHKLDTLCRYHDIELNHHDSKSDANACMELYKIYKQGI